MDGAQPRKAQFYRSSAKTLENDLTDLTKIIEQDESGGLKKPDPAAVRRAMWDMNAILLRAFGEKGALEPGEALACAVLYDRGELADGRTLYEFGSVGAWRMPGYGLLPIMSRLFSIQLQIYAANAVLIGIARFDDALKNWASLKQLERSGFNAIDSDLLELVNATRHIEPGRKVLVFDPQTAVEQAHQLLSIVRSGVIHNRDRALPDLIPAFDLSPISDGLLEDFIEQCETKRSSDASSIH